MHIHKRRRLIVMEVLSSERHFVNVLNELVTVFYEPLLQQPELLSVGLSCVRV
jgi:hypothetical protein